MRQRAYPRLQWPRLAVGGFALLLMLLMVFHARVGTFALNVHHTAASHADHSRQPCLDSTSFDSTVPRSGFSLLVVPHYARQSLRLNLIRYSGGPREFRLYNRPPPLS